MDDVERQLLRLDASLLRHARFHRGGLATHDHVPRLDGQAVDQHGALLDPALDARPGVLRQQPRQRLIQALAGVFRRKIDPMGLELGRQ